MRGPANGRFEVILDKMNGIGSPGIFGYTAVRIINVAGPGKKARILDNSSKADSSIDVRFFFFIQINDFGISFGLGLPIYRSNSTINISAEFGKRGTTKYNLVRENYAKFNLSANLHDLWFMSRKID